MKIKERFQKWRKKRIEEKYFKTFPERKGMATMEIVQSRIKPQTFYKKVNLDPVLVPSSAIQSWIKRDIARDMGEELLEQGMIEIHTEMSSPDPCFYGQCAIATIRVLPPEEKVRWPI